MKTTLKLGYDPVTRAWPAWLDQLRCPRELLPEVLVPGASIAEIHRTSRALSACRPQHASRPAPPTASRPSLQLAPIDLAMPSHRSGTTLVVKVLAAQPIFAADQGVYSHRLGGAGLPAALPIRVARRCWCILPQTKWNV